ncbi:hypothetical protein LTR37_019659 [Vermiconidia calcicola]|uniref:Uncharacterized protein n=1 Tax=Vermiconidia calcicola TaxID=1690605 RepID=A0ACC3MF21_9PEZI|nr:hypothetical protein LTR37_019659 [Vermiconidia calcicola]
MAPQGSAYHTDWIFSIESNVHVANHLDWFINFKKFKPASRAGSRILGVGDVVLNVKTSATRKGSNSHRKLILRDVLFVPSSLCNILGGPIMKDYWVEFGEIGTDGGLEDERTGVTAGLFNHVCLFKLWLAGQARGSSSLDSDTLYYIIAQWCDEARAVWIYYGNYTQPRQPLNADAAPYTAAEKAWLRRAYGGEYKFLLSFGLKIHSEEDREEGRRIARGFIENEAAEEDRAASAAKRRGNLRVKDAGVTQRVSYSPMSHYAITVHDNHRQSVGLQQR